MEIIYPKVIVFWILNLIIVISSSHTLLDLRYVLTITYQYKHRFTQTSSI